MNWILLWTVLCMAPINVPHRSVYTCMHVHERVRMTERESTIYLGHNSLMTEIEASKMLDLPLY